MKFEKKIGPIKFRYGGEHALPTKQRLAVIGVGLLFYGIAYIVTTNILYTIILALIPALFLNRYYRYKNAKKQLSELTESVHNKN